MPAFPSPATLTAHRRLHHAARVGMRPGSVIIAGMTYDAEVYVGPVESEMHPDGAGTLLVQRIVARVLKTALAAAPARQTALMIQGLRFEVGKIEGQTAAEPAWLIHASRLPKTPT